MVGETGFQTEIPVAQTNGNPRFSQDCRALVTRTCAGVQCAFQVTA